VEADLPRCSFDVLDIDFFGTFDTNPRFVEVCAAMHECAGPSLASLAVANIHNKGFSAYRCTKRATKTATFSFHVSSPSANEGAQRQAFQASTKQLDLGPATLAAGFQHRRRSNAIPSPRDCGAKSNRNPIFGTRSKRSRFRCPRDARKNHVAFGAKRTSDGRQDRLARSLMTQPGHSTAWTCV
jgi:hypothetical protein